jgi:hypothetical protein
MPEGARRAARDSISFGVDGVMQPLGEVNAIHHKGRGGGGGKSPGQMCRVRPGIYRAWRGCE